VTATVAQAGFAARRTLHQPGELAVRVAFYGCILVVFAALWSAATRANGGSIAGYDVRALLWYVAFAEGSVIATKPRMIETIGWDISSGAIVTEMLRPASVVGLRLAAELGEAVVRLACAWTAGAAVAWLYVGAPPSAEGIALALPSSLLALGCNLAAQHAFAGAAFWLRDARSTWFLYQKLVFLLGGMLLPLEFLPHMLAAVARALPFSAMAYAPARLASGHVEPWLLAIQAGWLVVLLGAAVAVFGAGERRLEVVGG
jgi:viologen exporter family transport system permease protein